mgnify:FL=1
MEDEKKQSTASGTPAVLDRPEEPATVDLDQAEQAPKKKKERRPMDPKKKKKWIKRGIILVVILAIIGFLFSRCASSGNQILSSTYIPASAAYQSLTVAVSGSGTIQPANSYKVTALVTGEILSDSFEEGQTVEKGDVLYQIDASDVQSSVDQARIQLEQAKLSYQDTVDLLTTGSGTVENLYVKVGDSVAAGAAIADVVDRSTVSLKVPFLKQDAQSMYVGQSCTVTVSGYPDVLTGRVTEVSAADTVDAGGAFVRNVRVEVANPGGITDQMQGSVSVGGKYSTAMGQFSYASSSQVTAKAGGTVTSLVKEGTRVSANQSIGTLGSTSTAAGAGLSLEQAELNYQNALDRLEDYTITAPISGTVVEKVNKAGDKLDGTAAANTKGYMAEIYDLSYLEFEMNIHELDINKVEVGQKVEVTADSLEDQTFTGTVTRVNINGTANNGITTYPVTIRLDGTGEELLAAGLWTGMNVSAKIVVEQVDNALCIPVDAVSRGENGTDVVQVALPGALNEDGTAVADMSKVEERTVKVGRNDEEYIEILDGLEEGDIVLIQNQASSIMDMMMG